MVSQNPLSNIPVLSYHLLSLPFIETKNGKTISLYPHGVVGGRTSNMRYVN